MKGIAHFAAGLAVASFFPGIIHSAAQSQSFGLLLGGFAGLLPDDSLWQVDEAEVMTVDDYDTIIDRGWLAFLAEYMPRSPGHSRADCGGNEPGLRA